MVTVDSSSYPRAYFGETIKPEENTAVSEPVNPQITDAVTQTRQRRKSAKITAQQKAEKQKRDLYLKQESRRATKVQVDQKIVLWTWIVGIIVAFATSAVVSFNGITAVAQYVGLAAPWMASLFFFFIELMYVLFLIAYLLLQSRVDDEGNPERSGGAFWGMFLFGSVAVIANGFHTLDFWQYDWTNPQMWAGIVLSIAAPVAIISASKMASRVVFARAIRL
jgi:thiol:disulfide interchange protein